MEGIYEDCELKCKACFYIAEWILDDGTGRPGLLHNGVYQRARLRLKRLTPRQACGECLRWMKRKHCGV
jgi:hypothetical protein